MSVAEERIQSFETKVLLPSLREICSAPKVLEAYEAQAVETRPHPDANTEEILAALAGALRRRPGPSLVFKDRRPPAGISRLGGRYVMTVIYDVQGDEVYASPAVMFWMRFNEKLHAFAHRYDNAVARHRVEAVTRPHVLNHVLGSFDFFKLYAYSPQPFPGYR